jgi:hypothetical protein
MSDQAASRYTEIVTGSRTMSVWPCIFGSSNRTRGSGNAVSNSFPSGLTKRLEPRYGGPNTVTPLSVFEGSVTARGNVLLEQSCLDRRIQPCPRRSSSRFAGLDSLKRCRSINPLPISLTQEIVLPFHHEKIDFMIKAERLSYEFYYKSLDNGDYERIGSMATDALTRARIFDSFCTGTMLGIYALGEPNHPCLQPAYFNSISWSGRRGGPSEWSPSGRNSPAQPQRAVLDFKFD